MDAFTVSPDQFQQITELLAESGELHRAAKAPGLTLAQKLKMLEKSKLLREQAMDIGK